MSLLRKNPKSFFGTIVAKCLDMDGTIFGNLSDLATVVGMDAIAAMISDNIAIIPLLAFTFFLVFLTAKSAKGNAGGFFNALLAGDWFKDDHAADRMFERRNISAMKTCPSCTEQMPLSILICEACDYNFLSGMVGHGHRMLPAPESRDDEMPARVFAFRA